MKLFKKDHYNKVFGIREELMKESMESIIKALDASGEFLVEPLPAIFFTGTASLVKEKSSGKVFHVYMESYSRDGAVVTVRKHEEFVDLKRDEYELLEVLDHKGQTVIIPEKFKNRR